MIQIIHFATAVLCAMAGTTFVRRYHTGLNLLDSLFNDQASKITIENVENAPGTQVLTLQGPFEPGDMEAARRRVRRVRNAGFSLYLISLGQLISGIRYGGNHDFGNGLPGLIVFSTGIALLMYCLRSMRSSTTAVVRPARHRHEVSAEANCGLTAGDDIIAIDGIAVSNSGAERVRLHSGSRGGRAIPVLVMRAGSHVIEEDCI